MMALPSCNDVEKKSNDKMGFKRVNFAEKCMTQNEQSDDAYSRSFTGATSATSGKNRVGPAFNGAIPNGIHNLKKLKIKVNDTNLRRSCKWVLQDVRLNTINTSTPADLQKLQIK